MKILYVASEVAPFAASGGLGDVIGALPACVASSGAHDVAVITPLYKTMKAEYRERLEHVEDISFKLAWRDTGASVYKLLDSGVTYYFVENHYYFDRARLYGEYDDAERFAFFSMAVLEYIKKSSKKIDILHANDWQTALTIVYLKTIYAKDPCLSNIKTVYTIHNIEYQGKYDPYILGDVFALGTENLGVLEYKGCINLMKGALVTSDYITTVSPNYAKELEYDFFAFGLQDIIKAVSGKMKGVINGIDYAAFSPEKDRDIFKTYNTRMIRSGKAKNKAALCEDLGLSTDPNVPLLVMITRLATQKGIDLLLCIADELLANNVQLIVLGTGEAEYETKLIELQNRHPNFRALIKFDRALSKKLYAAADIFLMPSKSEPCGLSQMIACSYGTVPVVRNVGGLHDTISPYPLDDSNGFRFDNYNAHDFLGAILYAVGLYTRPSEWHELRRRAKSSSFTWEKSAVEYVNIYSNLLN